MQQVSCNHKSLQQLNDSGKSRKFSKCLTHKNISYMSCILIKIKVFKPILHTPSLTFCNCYCHIKQQLLCFSLGFKYFVNHCMYIIVCTVATYLATVPQLSYVAMYVKYLNQYYTHILLICVNLGYLLIHVRTLLYVITK